MNTAQHLIASLVFFLVLNAYAQENTGTPAHTPEPSVADSVEEIPAPQKSILRTAATKSFNKPLYFDQLDNGVVLPPLELEYELANKGEILKIGNVSLSAKNFFFALVPLGKSYPGLDAVLSNGDASKYALVMAWPEHLLGAGTIEMISRTGEVLWTHTFTQKDRDQWTKNLAQWRKALIAKGVDAKKVQRGGVFGSHYAIENVQSLKAPFWGQKDVFHFCVTQTDGKNSTRICSQKYGTKSTGDAVVMGKVRTDDVNPRVLVQNENAPLKNSVPVAADMPTAFYAELATGESYEFVTMPNKLELMDISDTKKPTLLRIVGYETRPIGRSIILNKEQYSSFTKAIGFESTIGDTRVFWAAALNTKEPKLYLPGVVGGVFKQKFELSEIPRAQSRPYLSARTPTGTYSDGIVLEGRKQPVSEITSDEISVSVDPKDPAHFYWKFQAKERGKINRSYVNVDFGDKVYRSYHELYKGYPRELSGRFTAVQASSEFIVMGEIAYNQWFEDLFGWTNYWLSRQRWGVSVKYFQSFMDLKIDDAGGSAPLSVLTADARYRLTPGLWGRDESLGLLASYQSVKFDQLEAPMMGVGAFWARSMPKVFDDFFNLLPFLRYPKWVDMEFIYYLSSMDSNVELNSSMSLNFHGKVLWTDTFFGEAGFGVKRYGFTNTSLNQKAELNTFYGTVGVGINF